MSKTNDTGKATDKKPDKTNTIKKVILEIL